MRLVARRLGYPDAQVAAAPTGITVSLGRGEPASFLAMPGSLRLDQAADVVLIRYRLAQGQLGPAQALTALIGLGPTAAIPTGRDLPRLVTGLGRDHPHPPAGLAQRDCRGPGGARGRGVGPAGAGPAVAQHPAAHPGRLRRRLWDLRGRRARLADRPLRTLLPPLAVLLPGATLVTGISELAAGAMVAGSARLVYGSVQLLLFALGVVAAARLIGLPAAELGNIAVRQLGGWAPVAGLLMIGVGLCLLEDVSFRLFGWILAVLVIAFAAQTLGQRYGGPGVGSFLGAVAATLGSRLAELIKPTLPRLVVFLPSFWLLVPGSLGLLGVSQFGLDSANAAAATASAVVVVAAIALGLIVGATTARALAGLSRRLLRRRNPAAAGRYPTESS